MPKGKSQKRSRVNNTNGLGLTGPARKTRSQQNDWVEKMFNRGFPSVAEARGDYTTGRMAKAAQARRAEATRDQIARNKMR